jgi:hypothetical protein
MSTERRPLTAEEARGKDTNAILEGFVDRCPWTFFDTVTQPAAVLSATYNPFAVPIGSPDAITGQQKTKLQTNMRRGNQFPPPQCLIMQSIGVHFAGTQGTAATPMVKADIDRWLNSCYIEFRIDEKIFHEGFLWMFPSGGGLSGTTTNNAESAWVNGLPAVQYTRRYDRWSRYIAPQQQFSLTVVFPGTPPTTDGTSVVIFTLDGITDRSVQ